MASLVLGFRLRASALGTRYITTTPAVACCRVHLPPQARKRSTSDQDTRPNVSLSKHLYRSPDPVKLRSWAFDVEQFGRLSVLTSSTIRVTPIDLLEYVDSDKAFVHLLQVQANDDEPQRSVDDAVCQREKDDLDSSLVQYKRGIISICDKKSDEDIMELDKKLMWLVEVPLSYDVDIKTTDGGSIQIEELENQTCELQTERGDIVTSKLKSGEVTIQSTSGDITCCKVLQGNVTIATENKGMVISDKLQGHVITVSADSGNILIKDIYSKTSSFTTVKGNVHLGNAHGDVTVSCQQGDVTVGSLDGCLQSRVRDGNVSAYIAQHTHVDIASKQGDVNIKSPENLRTQLHLEAASQGIRISQELKDNMLATTSEENGVQTVRGSVNGGGQSTLKVTAEQGNISLAVQSWLESLHLLK